MLNLAATHVDALSSGVLFTVIYEFLKELFVSFSYNFGECQTFCN